MQYNEPIGASLDPNHPMNDIEDNDTPKIKDYVISYTVSKVISIEEGYLGKTLLDMDKELESLDFTVDNVEYEEI